MPKPIEDESVRLDNLRGGYSTAANWATHIREAGCQSVKPEMFGGVQVLIDPNL